MARRPEGAKQARGAKQAHSSAVVQRNQGESAQVEACWRRILSLHRPEQSCSLDEGIYGHITRRNLAVLAAERGDRAAAARLWRAALADCPGDREALANLERLAPRQGTGTSESRSPVPS